jgi:hypothetical protein
MTDPHADNAGHDETDMTEMLNELRILLPGAQLLNGFLITLPFNSGFREIVEVEKWIFMATFFCSLSSLILFTAPAVQHRILRPLDNRPRFKNLASKQMLAGRHFCRWLRAVCISGYRGGCWPPSWRCRCGAGRPDLDTVVGISVVVASPAEERPAL